MGILVISTAAGLHVWSTPGEVAVPAAPSGLTATAVSASRIDLAWTDNASDETGFVLERAPDVAGSPGTFAQIATPAANATSYNNTSLTAETKYHYRVKAVNAAGSSSYSNTANATTAEAVAGTTIDADWLTANGPSPYELDQADATYLLTVDVETEGPAFFFTAPNVTLDLNGHAVTYDSNVAPGVTNGGFEAGSGPSDIPGWDVTGAPGAVRAAARRGFWGDWMLRVAVPASTTYTIVSDPIAIPTAGPEYCAMIQPKIAAGSATVTISVVDDVTDAVLATANSSDPDRGTLAFVPFVPTTTNAVRLKVDLIAGGSGGTVDLDHADLTRSREYGIVVSPSWYSTPEYLWTENIQDNGSSTTNATIKNGTLTQGAGRSYGASPIFAKSLTGLTLQDVVMTSSGASTNQVEGIFAVGPWVVTGCTLTNNMDILDDRMRAFAAIRLSTFAGAATISDNTIRGVHHNGIAVSGPYLAYDDPTYLEVPPGIGPLQINNNDIRVTTYWTDGYGIGFGGADGLEVAYNTVAPFNGRGMFIDGNSGWTINGTIHDNYIEAREAANLEYDPTGIEATALRMRNGRMANLTFSDNTFAGITGPGLAWAAIGARISHLNGGTFFPGTAGQNDDSNNLFTGNRFLALVLSPDPDLTSLYDGNQAWGLTLSRIDAGTGLTFRDNICESNVTPLNIGDNDSASGDEHDVSFWANTILKNPGGTETLGNGDEAVVAPDSEGLRPFTGVVTGDWGNRTGDIRFISQIYDGATPGITFISSGLKDVSTGWRLSLAVKHPGGSAAVGATVIIKDKDDETVYSGVTDASGNLADIPVVTTVIRQTTTDPEALTTDARGPHSLEITSGSESSTTILNLTADDSQIITLS